MYNEIIMWTSQIGSIICVIYILLSNNLIINIMCFILMYVLMGICLYSMGLGILSLIYILVYVGAISILFLFIISIIDLKNTELSFLNNKSDKLLIVIITTIINIVVYIYIDNIIELIKTNNFIFEKYKLIKKLPDINITELLIISEYYLISHPILFLFFGLTLLLGIIGAIYIVLN